MKTDGYARQHHQTGEAGRGGAAGPLGTSPVDFLDTGVVRYRLLNRVVAYGVCTVFAVWGGPNSVVLSSWADGGQSPVFPVVVASADSVGGFT